MIKKRSLLDKLGTQNKTVLPSTGVNSALGRSVGSYQPSIQPIQQPIIPKPILPSVNLSRPVTRDLGTPTLRESTQRENAKQSVVDAKVEKQTKQQASDRAKMLERQISDKYGIDVKRANSPIEAVNMLSLIDDDQKEQFKKDFAEYSFVAERSNPFRAGAEAGFNVLPTNLEKTEGKEDVQTAKGYGAGRLVGGIGQQLAFNSALGGGIESLTSKLLPKATPFVAETIKDVAIGTGTQLAEAPFDKPTATQFAGNVALDIALNALFGVIGNGLSKVDLSNIKTAKPSQVVGDVAQKLNVSIVEADKVVDDAIDFYVNKSGVADAKQFDQLQLEAPKNVNSDAIGIRLSEKVKAVRQQTPRTEELKNVVIPEEAKIKLTPFDDENILKERYLASTQESTHTINTPERIKLREDITKTLSDRGSFSGIDLNGKEVYNGSIDKGKQAFLVIGNPSAGKSTVFANPLSKQYNAKIIDSDMAKEFLPEYKNGSGAGIVHLESAAIAEENVLVNAILNGENIVLPKIGKNDASLRELITLLKEEGYTTHLKLNTIPSEKAAQRAVSRYYSQGRYVDPNYVLNDVQNKPDSVYEILKKEVDTYEKYSNDVEIDQKPKFIEYADNANLNRGKTEYSEDGLGRGIGQSNNSSGIESQRSKESKGLTLDLSTKNATQNPIGANNLPNALDGVTLRSDFSVKKPIYPTLDPKFAKERPSVLTASDVKRIEPTLKPTKTIASKVESPTMTKVDNVASKFESENLTTGDNILNSGEIKERGFSENIRTDKNRVDELRKEFDENPEFYETLSNKSTLESAQARFDRGYDEAVKDFRLTSDTIRADNVPLAKLIADEAVKRGDMETAREVVVKAAESLTKAGQFSQAAKILRETNDPITVMRFVNNEIKKLNTQGSKRYGKGWENIKLDENELDLIAKITKDTSDEQKEEVFQQIFDSMVKRIPTTKREKFDAWRRIAMLFNPKTHVRNTLGNGLMRGLKTIADKQAQVMELSIPKELRTKGFATKELKEVSKNYFDANKKTLLEGSRWEIFGVASPFSEKRIFKNQFLESLNDISKKTLEGEDIFFFKSNFISDLAGFMNARGLKEPTEEAVAYALRRSQEATFRQANAVANAINTMKGSRIGLLVDAAIPFTKTPANILQTGIDYSPIGAMKSVVQILNKAEPKVAIENLSKGLTGTGLALIGAWASYNGLARGAYEKSNKVEGLYQATGMLPNSIKTPGGSYTIDWAQPIAMPFFMGVAFMDELKKGGKTKTDAAFNALLQSGETLVQQSMLSGVKDLFGGYGTMTEKIIQLPINYMTQGFPTVGGQIARVIDPLKRQIDYSNIIDSTTTSLQARTPGLSIDLPVKRDILGKPQEYGKGLLNVFQQFLSPGFIGKESKDPVVNEISRLYESEGADFLPKARVTNFTDEKIKYNLTTKEISEVQKIMGEYTNKQLSSMINSYEYRNATDAERAKMIKKANEIGYDLAKKTIVEARKK